MPKIFLYCQHNNSLQLCDWGTDQSYNEWDEMMIVQTLDLYHLKMCLIEKRPAALPSAQYIPIYILVLHCKSAHSSMNETVWISSKYVIVRLNWWNGLKEIIIFPWQHVLKC